MEQALQSTLRYIFLILPVMAIAMFTMNIIQHSGLINKITWLSRPLIKYGHFSKPVGITFLTAFGSPSAANAMLRQLYSNNSISKKELFLAVMANAFPVMVMESRYMLPVIVPLMGEAGALIFTILLFVRFLQTIAVLTFSRFILNKMPDNNTGADAEYKRLQGKELIFTSIKAVIQPLKRIILITVPITFGTFYLNSTGFFAWLSQKIHFVSSIFPVPVEGLAVVAAFMGHSVAGYTMAGNLLIDEILPVKEIVLTVLSAKVLSSIVFALRHTLPSYMSIFGTMLGIQIMTASYILRNTFTIFTIILLYIVW